MAHGAWGLSSAPALRASSAPSWPIASAPPIADLVRTFAPLREVTEQGELLRGLPVRIALERHGARCEIQLGERALFYPSDAALASWTAQAHQQKAEIVFD